MSTSVGGANLTPLRSRGWLSACRSATATDAMWLSASQVLSGVATLLAIRFLTNAVSPSVYGLANLLTTGAALGISLICSPFLHAAMRFYPEMRRAADQAALRAVTELYLRRAVVVLIAIAMGVGAYVAPSIGASSLVGVALAALIAVDVRKAKELTFLTAARHQKTYAVWNGMDVCGRPLGALLALNLFQRSSGAMVVGYAAVSLMLLVAFYPCWQSQHRPVSAPDALKVEFRRYALPLLPLALVGWITAASDRYIIGAFGEIRDVGVYAASYGLVMGPFVLVSATLLTTLRPILFGSVSAGNNARTRVLIRAWLAALVVVCVAGAVVISVLRHSIAALLLAPQYRGGASFIPWFCAGFVFLHLSQALNTISMAYRCTAAVSVSESVGAVSSIAITIPMVRWYGAGGAAASVPLYYSLQCMCACILAARAGRVYANRGAQSYNQP